MITFGFCSGRIQRRSPFVLYGQLLYLTGFALTSRESELARTTYVGTFLIVSGGYALYPSMAAW